MSVLDKTAVIIGGGTGIGAGCALVLAEAGCRVALGGRREEKLQETAARFAGENPLVYHACDVADRDSVNRFFQWAYGELGRIDILVNSAGINIPNRAMAEMRPEDWDKVLEVNATGAYNCMHAVLPQMRERGDGLIVNVSSIAGIRASLLGGIAYSASKFAMSALGLAVGREEREHGIRVTNIYPGEVDTPILENRPTPVSDEHRAKILQPEDVGAAVLMVASLPARAHVPELTIKPTTQDFS